MKILFILKEREIYSDSYYSTVNSGLYNSATFVNNMLIKNHINSNLIEVRDNNDIDRVVSIYKPNIVIIEALWVTPSKFEILKKLHPNVTWIIRLHSEIPFLANEGIAIEWLKEYTKYKNILISSNSISFIESMKPILKTNILYLPNYYPISNSIRKSKDLKSSIVNIGLFGAIRPLKNTLTQAIAAIIYADKHNKILNLHINTERIEQKGHNNLKNIRALFKDTRHNLIEHKWLKHKDFVKLVSEMDMGLQVSLSETYNIVAADFVNQYVPIIASEEIPFVNTLSKVESEKDAIEICKSIELTFLLEEILIYINKLMLKTNSIRAEKEWLKIFKNEIK